MADLPPGVQVVESPFMPPGKMYLIPSGLGLALEPMRLAEPLWEPAPSSSLGPVAARERDRALDWLAAQLDDWCTDLGLDPETTWREPRRTETRAAFHLRQMVAFHAEIRYALPIIDRPTRFVTINDV